MIVLYKLDTTVIYYDSKLDFTTIRGQLEDGSQKGYDLHGNELTPYDAIKALTSMSSRRIGETISENITSNIQLSPILIAVVRDEMISTSLSALGLSATSMLSKLSGVIGAIQVGMFKEAALMLRHSVVVDAFLTRERLDLYATLLETSDALAQNGYT